jgi:hypothetical protein
MTGLPEKYNPKIETIKRAILVRSGFLSEFGNKVSLELTGGDATRIGSTEKFKIYELFFTLEINGVLDCPDCAHEPNDIINVITEYQEKVYKAAKFYVDEELTIKSGNSLRGVLVNGFKFHWDEIYNVQFEIFFDVANNY